MHLGIERSRKGDPIVFEVTLRLWFDDDRLQTRMRQFGAPYLTEPKRRTSLVELEEGPLLTLDEAELLRTGRNVTKSFTHLFDAERFIQRVKGAIDVLPEYWEQAWNFRNDEVYPADE